MRLYNFLDFSLFAGAMVLLLSSCNGGQNSITTPAKPAIEVRVATVKIKNIKEYQQYNGVTQYQKKESLRSNITGYVTYIAYERGDAVRLGATFATVRTKEQRALADAVSIDSSLAQFAKPLQITSNGSGIITALNVVKGDYVAEGDVLAVIAQLKTMEVKVNVPFSEKYDVNVGTPCQIMIPNQPPIIAQITSRLPVIDSINQTQTFLIALPNSNLPEGLNVNVQTVTRQDSTALTIPQTALQTNELMTDFWVMKVVGDTLAVKQKVIPMLQNDSVVQIDDAGIGKGVLVVTEGSYQMQDSTKVKIIKE